MTSLAQLVAVDNGVKSTTNREITGLHRVVQADVPLTGISREYTAKDELNGDKLPSESTLVQVRAQDVLTGAQALWTRLWDVVATKEAANTEARADVVVEGTTLAKDVPVTTLLFLDKQLTDLHTFVAKLPRLDPAKAWEFSEAQNCYATAPVETVRTKKIPRNHERAAATDKHPAQVDVYMEDVTVGTWSTIHYSGALPAKVIAHMLARVTALQEAVKYAREQANTIAVTDHKLAKALLDYALAPAFAATA